MALTRTTLAAACGLNDTTIRVASATGFAVGNYIRIDNEVLQQTAAADGTIIAVRRGLNGSAQVAHAVTSGVNTGLGTDFPAAGVVATAELQMFAARQGELRYSYGASGALTPSGGLHVLNGTSVLVMTLAVPSTLIDGDEMIIIGTGGAAHTVTFATAMGNGGSNLDLATFAAGGQQVMRLIAMNGIWCWAGGSVLAGTLTNITVTMS